jgi:ArsR family transcriptional regulator, arsenate/arsenite/antimonite-responsive transcriptional repressor
MPQRAEPTLGADLAVFAACADATRLRILFLLAARELCVCELVEVLQMPQGKVSRHLLALRKAGLVRPRREGTWMHYSRAPGATALTRRLHRYLRDAPVGLPQADRQRLEALRN